MKFEQGIHVASIENIAAIGAMLFIIECKSFVTNKNQK